MDKLRAMELFVRAAEGGSFAEAAQSLNLANATVTVSVRNLERAMNVMLIRRDTRRQTLTREGEQVLSCARGLLKSMAQLEDELRNPSLEPHGRLNIEVPHAFGQTLLAPMLPAFAKRYPKIRTSVTLTKERHNLIARSIDVAVRMDHVENEGLVARPLFEAEYVVCGTSKVVASLPAHPADIDPRFCIGVMLEGNRYPLPWEFSRGSRKVVIEPCGPLDFNDIDAAIAAVKSGIGIACILDVYAASHLEAGTLVRAYPQWSMRKRTGYLVMTTESAKSLNVQAFTGFLNGILGSAKWAGLSRTVPIRAKRRPKSP
jgi:LysR family transcriptional regulator for bpeEF and oprC